MPIDTTANWIFTPQGTAINLAFLSKVLVMTAGSGSAWSVIYYHGIANGTGSKNGATIAEKYANQTDAIVAYNKVLLAIKGAVNVLDLSYQLSVSISAITPNTGTIAGGDNVVLTGTGFTNGFSVAINGALCTNLLFTDPTTISFDTPANPAGTYSLVYAGPDFNFVYPMAFTYS